VAAWIARRRSTGHIGCPESVSPASKDLPNFTTPQQPAIRNMTYGRRVPSCDAHSRRTLLLCGMSAVLAGVTATVSLMAQEPPVHYMYPQGLPPGVLGSMRVAQGGPLAGYYQPVEIRVPQGCSLALAEGGRFTETQAGPIRVGLLVGQVYRLCLLNIPQLTDVELFPTIELVDRVYPPRGLELRFPILVDFTQEDLRLAATGKLVTRVIYLEDPKVAVPAHGQGPGKDWFEVAPGKDPVAVADALGQPMAILRIGGRTPDPAQGPDPAFLFGCPPLVRFAPRPTATPEKPAAPSNAALQTAPATWRLKPVAERPNPSALRSPAGGISNATRIDVAEASQTIPTTEAPRR
jgi:hypothetical protein